MKFGDKIKFIRDYDEGLGWTKGAVVTVAMGRNNVTPTQAVSLCRDCSDGNGPFAEPYEEPGDVTEDK